MRLHEQVKHYQALADARKGALDYILSYVQSEKFSVDNMVNRDDIILRIREYENLITDEFNV